ncbi:MAG: hypothetical protein SFX18_03275 [Pirellulales bacterium]|nr:hypothetical protein [Pirellulales bacterium]
MAPPRTWPTAIKHNGWSVLPCMMITLSWWVVMPIAAIGQIESDKTAIPRNSTITAAEQTLRGAGLTPVERVWYLPEELHQRQRLPELEKLDQHAAELNQLIARHVQAREVLRQQIVQLQETTRTNRTAAAKLPPGAPAKLLLDKEFQLQSAQLTAAEKSFLSVEKWAMAAPLGNLTMDLLATRSELLDGILQLSAAAPVTAATYERLRSDSQITAALAGFAAPQRLGPAKAIAAEAKILSRLAQQQLRQAFLPLARSGNDWLVTGIFNERHVLTVVWDAERSETLLPHSLFQKWELEIDRGQEPRRITLEDQEIQIRPSIIKTVRLGTAAANDVTVWVMPAEAEHFGPRLGYELQQTLRATLRPERLAVEIAVPEQKLP